MTKKITKKQKTKAKSTVKYAILSLTKTTGKVVEANLAAKKLFGKNIKEIKKYKVDLVNTQKEIGAKNSTKIMEINPDYNEEFVELKEMFNVLTQSIKDAIIMADTTDTIFFWNKAAEIMFGYKKEEALGKKLHTIIPAKMDWEKYSKDMKEFSETGKNWVIGGTFELEAKKRDGSLFPIELSVSSAKIKGKNIAIGICRDITLRKKNSEEIENRIIQAEKINRLMVGRELKMIQLKKQIIDLKNQHNHITIESEQNRFQIGIELEEDVIQALETDYETMVLNSELNKQNKEEIIKNLHVLLTDSRKHEKALKDLL